MSDSEWGPRAGEHGSLVYRDYDDQDHAYADVHDLARDRWSDGRRDHEWRTAAHPLVEDLLEAGHPAPIDVLQALVDGADSDPGLDFVGAGRLEDLLAHHGHAEVFVDEIERRSCRRSRWLGVAEQARVGKVVGGIS